MQPDLVKLLDPTVTLNERERSSLMAFWNDMNDVKNETPTAHMGAVISPELRDLIMIVIVAGLSSIDNGDARYWFEE